MKIRNRLTLLFVLVVASLLLLFSLFIYYQYNQFRELESAQRLEEKALTALRSFEQATRLPQQRLPVPVVERVSAYDARDSLIYSNQSAPVRIRPEQLDRARAGQALFFSQHGQDVLAFRYRSTSGQTLVLVASSQDQYGFTKLRRLREMLLLGWLVSLLVVGAVGWLFASDALRPVSELIRQVNAISASNINERLRVGTERDELNQLAQTFNGLLSRLEDAFVSQRSFVSHASHELRTPLTVMMGQIEVALMQPRTGAEYQATLENVLEEVQNMTRLVNGLLDLARVSADAATLPFGLIRIDELLWQARSGLVTEHTTYQIDIEYDSLPEDEEDLMIPGEESLLRTAFRNLIENGCKYSADHTAHVALQVTPEYIIVTFRDHGSGIAPEDLPHIFEPFYRSANNTMSATGHGIGLALTRRIVELHQGLIEVESVPQQGTTFRVSFFRATSAATPAPQPAELSA